MGKRIYERRPLSLYPLTPEEALADLLHTKAPSKEVTKKAARKGKAARRKAKKRSKRK
jgi:hypothetical protein